MSREINRRVIVGESPDDRSTVQADERDLAQIHYPGDVVLQEIWWQEKIPARPGDRGTRAGEIGLEPPAAGVLVRLVTFPASSPSSEWVPNLHSDSDRHVITMIDGELDLILEEAELTLRAGDSVIISGNQHDWRNNASEPATFISTTMPRGR